MRLLCQRVTRASVSVEGELVSEIGKGLLVLVGITHGDSKKDQEVLVNRILRGRFWDSPETGRSWGASVESLGLEVLLVSQFTLFGYYQGSSPDFHAAMPSAKSGPFFEEFVARVRAGYDAEKVKTGVFGTKMEVSLVNDGPVTLLVDTNNKKNAPLPKKN